MALKATSFNDALDYKIINETAATNSLNSNVTTAPGKLYSIKAVNGSSSAAYIKIFDDPAPTLGATLPILVIRVTGSATAMHEILGGLDFTTLSIAATLNPSPTDTNAPNNGTVALTLVCS